MKNTIGFTGTFEGEGLIMYERYLNKVNSIEIRYGFKKGNNVESPLSYESDQARFYGGNIFQFGYRRYLNSRDNHRHQWYISPSAMYKDYSFDHVPIRHILNESHQTCEIRSSHKQVYSFKALLGKKYYLEMSNTVALIIDAYIGLGVRNRVFKDTIFEQGDSYPSQTCYCTPLPVPLTENSSDQKFSLQAGVLVGIAF